MRLIQSGPKTTKIVLVGEAPGAQEDSSGVPFSGGSGQLLDKMLEKNGILRRDCFVTNIAHVRPPENDFNWFLKPKIRPELALGILQLKKDLEEIRPNVVAALGAQSLRILTGKPTLDKWRGSILPSTLVPGLKVVGTYHPAAILRVYDYKAVTEFDLRRLAAQSLFPEIRRPQREFILNPPREHLIGLVAELRNAEWLSVDIECFESVGGWTLACVGFSDRPDRAVTIPYDEQWQKQAILELCSAPCKKVLQNGTFDATVLASHQIPLINFAWDTMLAHHALYPECASGEDEMSALSGRKRQAAIAKGLAFQTSIYTEEPFYKDDGKLWKQTNDLQMFWTYNSRDAAVTREIRDVQERGLEEFGTWDVFHRRMSLVWPCMVVTNRGIRIDPIQKEKLRKGYETEIDNLQKFLNQTCGFAVNVKSSKQVTDLLYNKLGLPHKYSKSSGNLTADKDAIATLAGKSDNPVLHTIIAIRQRRDFIERYLDARVDTDQRMRCSWDITGTRTGRLSSRQSIYGSGMNLQNVPARKPEGEAIRRMFLADEGKVLVYRDFSQAEARVVAYLASCNRLIELFSDPTRDIHTENASKIFGKPVANITGEERYLAKRVVHASNYGMGADRLVEVVNEDAPITGIRIDRRTAQRLIEAYFMLYPEIKEVYWKEVERELKYSLTLTTPLGMKRQFFGRWDDKFLKEAYAFQPQSVVGELGAMVMRDCVTKIEPVIDGAQTLLNVHDSVMMQCWERDVEMVAQAMEDVMRIPITIKGQTFTIPTDCKVGLNWGMRPKDKPELNPDGLRDLEKWLREKMAA